ncbi:DUF4998 domain-containing protein [Snuella sedimenti]|uniref:Uncharacterized protein n=1 Tax=Snuella sedimenti TaxID=2798802 RepID=A0A8J7LSR0_9FLAO|nr:DUF4998 domain-containing protein [Snuella sedimenti]MBJ6367461.1 hypothetical protein [Snuella sedimenti]
MMKHIQYLALLVSITVGVLAGSCTQMDEFEKFRVGGAITYPGKVDSVIVYPGKERIKLGMILGADPTVNKIKAYWKNRQDSTEITFARTGAIDTLDLVIENLIEGTYNFELFAFDDFGNRSVVTNVSGTVYGTTYEASLLDRPLLTAACGNIRWGEANSIMLGVEVSYTDSSGNGQVVFVENDQDTSTLSDIDASETFEYRTAYKPDSLSIDTFYTPFKTILSNDISLSSGTYEVITVNNTAHTWMPQQGQTREVTQISDTQFSYILSTVASDQVPLVINVDPDTHVTSVELQEIGNFGPPWYMTAESIESNDNYACNGIISVRLHIDNLDRGDYWGDFTVIIKKK